MEILLRGRLAALALAILSSPAFAQSARSSQGYVPNRVVVKFRRLPAGVTAGVAAAQFSQLPDELGGFLSRYGVVSFRKVFSDISDHATVRYSSLLKKDIAVPDLYGWSVLETPPSVDVLQFSESLKSESLVEYAGPDYLSTLFETTPNDPDFTQQWHHKNTGQTGGASGADIKATFAWDRTTGSAPVKIAILDTGVSKTHPDLVANRIAGYDYIDNDADPDDTEGHGTHVAGIVAAAGNNATATTGIMWQASLMPVRVCGGAGCPNSAIASGLQYAADNGAKVINLSLGGATDDPILSNAVAYAVGLGVLVVAAAGNDGVETLFYPAAYPSVIAVCATDHNDQLASFSNRGNWITICAPGKDILSTSMAGSTVSMSGTSMACPMVVGAAGLIYSRAPSAAAASVRSLLTSGADSINAQNPTMVGKLGAGRLNVLKAAAIVPDVLGFSVLPNDPYVQNGYAVTAFSVQISSDFAPPQVRVFLADQFDRELGVGNTVTFNVAGQVNVAGSVQIGSLSLNYPMASQVKLRIALDDTVFVTTKTLVTWGFREFDVLPAGGAAAVWNGVFDPAQGGKATLRVTLRNPGHVKIQVFTTEGTLVKTLADEDVAGGIRTWEWSGRNERGESLASGLYLIRIRAPGINETKKTILVN
ncbi:MAG: hypothetical protein A2V88_12450 [Elusimicrobia bacterium RBG_16_66_12]|nr:MAG: hypothetical protein A2V88_12450 [Elusimicrobia bacterium RBG_16_66_12]